MVEHECQVYVGGIGDNAKEEDLKKLFRGCPLINHFLIRSNFAFVNFDSIQDAEEAVKKAHGRSMFDRRVKIELAMSSMKNLFDTGRCQSRGPSPQRTIYGRPLSKYCLEVENISSRISWKDLKTIISRCRPVFVNAHREEKHKGTLEFENAEDMHAVLKKFQNYELKGRKLKLTSTNPALQIPPVPTKKLESIVKKISGSISPLYRQSRSLKRRADSRYRSRSPEIATTFLDKTGEEKQLEVPGKENQVVTDQGSYKVSTHRERSSSEGRNHNFHSRIRRSLSRMSRASSVRSYRPHTPPEEHFAHTPSIGDRSTLSPSEEEGQYHSPSNSKENSRSKSKEKFRSRSPVKNRSKSKEKFRSRSPVKNRSKSKEKFRSRSPVRNREKSNVRNREKSKIRNRSRSKVRSRSRSTLRPLQNSSRRIYYFVGDSRSRSRSNSSSARFGEYASGKQLKETQEIVRMLYPKSSSTSRSRERRRLRCRRIYYFGPSCSNIKVKSRSRSRGRQGSSRAKTPFDDKKKTEETITKYRSLPELNPHDPRAQSVLRRYCSTKEWINCPSSSPQSVQQNFSLQSHETGNQSIGSIDKGAVSPKTSKTLPSRSVSRSRGKSKAGDRSVSRSRGKSRAGDRSVSRSRGKSIARDRSVSRASQDRKQRRQSEERKQDKDSKFLIDPSSKKPIKRKYTIKLSGTD